MSSERLSGAKWERGSWGHVFQGSHLGGTAIMLDDVYEGAEEDCAYIEKALSQLTQLTQERNVLREACLLAQQWLANCQPTAELDLPKPLPVLAAALNFPASTEDSNEAS